MKHANINLPAILRSLIILLLLPLLLVLMLMRVASASESALASAESPYFALPDDSGLDQFPLKDTQVSAWLNGVIASVHVRQTYRNQGTAPLNATYIFPGSTRAAVNGMTMTIGERRIVAKIKEREQAQRTYEAAKSQGKAASLLAQKRPNVFSMNVANIAPGDEVVIELDYTEILAAEDGVYEFVYPGVVGPRYGGDAPQSSAEVAWVSNPYLKKDTTGEAGYTLTVDMQTPIPINDLQSSSHKITSTWDGPDAVQIELADPGPAAANRDFILRYRLQGNALLTGLTRFDFRGEHYFMMMAEPPQRVQPADLPSRDYLFLVDVSGSMYGFPLDTATSLMRRLLAELQPRDSFNILFFSGGSTVLAPEPLAATPPNFARAMKMLNSMQGGGGTELLPALSRALNMPLAENQSRSVVVITDGYISAEDAAFRLIDENLGRSNLFAFGIGTSVNRFLIEGLATVGRARAFIVTNEADAERESERFRRYISAPVLTRIEITGRDVELYDVEPAAHPDLLAERPVMILGKYRGAGVNATIELNGATGSGPETWQFLLSAAGMDATLPQLWARKRLEHLYVFPDAAEKSRVEILGLGLKYSLLTSATSFVAVDETIRVPDGASRDVKQALPLPAGVSNLAVGGALQPMPEPEWSLLAGAGLLLMMYRGTRRRRVPAGSPKADPSRD
ncbi:MAG: VIT domain-containing protein [Gammaproteobacteria bacterium]